MNQSASEFQILIYGQDFLPSVGGVQTVMDLLARGLVARFSAALRPKLLPICCHGSYEDGRERNG